MLCVEKRISQEKELEKVQNWWKRAKSYLELKTELDLN